MKIFTSSSVDKIAQSQLTMSGDTAYIALSAAFKYSIFSAVEIEECAFFGAALATGADFAELYVQQRTSSVVELNYHRVDNVSTRLPYANTDTVPRTALGSVSLPSVITVAALSRSMR